MSDTEYIYGETSKKLSANSFSKTGFKFTGWATSETGGVQYTDQTTITGLSTGDINLYAVWADAIGPTITARRSSAIYSSSFPLQNKPNWVSDPIDTTKYEDTIGFWSNGYYPLYNSNFCATDFGCILPAAQIISQLDSKSLHSYMTIDLSSFSSSEKFEISADLSWDNLTDRRDVYCFVCDDSTEFFWYGKINPEYPFENLANGGPPFSLVKINDNTKGLYFIFDSEEDTTNTAWLGENRFVGGTEVNGGKKYYLHFYNFSDDIIEGLVNPNEGINLLSVNEISINSLQAKDGFNLKIEAKDNDGGSGLKANNSYQYYLSSSADSLTRGSWKTYKNGQITDMSNGISGLAYLFVKRVYDNANNISEQEGELITINGETYHRFGPYNSTSYSTLVVDPNGGTWNSYKTSQTFTRSVGTMMTIPNPTTPSSIRVTFDGNGGTAKSTSTTLSYSFSSWTKNPSTLNGTLSGTSYTFANAGSTDRLTANYSLRSITLPDATRPGYTFSGWYTSSSGGEYVGKAGDNYSKSTYTNLYAHWTGVKYNVTYDYTTNGGTSSTAKNTTVACGDDVNLSYTATRAGYTFVGWNTEKTATTGLTNLVMPANSITLYAIFERIGGSSATVTFIDYNGTSKRSTPKEVTLDSSSSATITTPAIGNYTGWIAKYWVKGTSPTATQAATSGGKATVTGDTKFYAVYEKTLTATFKDYSGNTSRTQNVTGKKTFNASGEASNPSIKTPAIGNYTGWNMRYWTKNTGATTTSQTVNSAATTTISDDTTFYARYYKNVTISFNMNGVSATAPSTQTATIETNANNIGNTEATSITLSAPTGIPSTRTFSGWYTASSGGTRVGGSGSSYSPPVSSTAVTLYAHWDTKTYTVTYNYSANGGSSSSKNTDSVAAGDPVDLNVVATKTGYSFIGWALSSSATTVLTSYTMPANNVTLYAIFGSAQSVVPTVKLTLNTASGGTYTSGNWTNQNIYHTITTATSSSISKYQYSQDNGTWTDITTSSDLMTSVNKSGNTLTYLIEEGVNSSFKIRGVFSNGSVTGESTVFTLRIDKNEPVVDVDPESFDYANSKRNAKISVSDSGGSGLSSTNGTYYVSTSSSSLQGDSNRTFSNGGSYAVWIDSKGASATYYLFVQQIKDKAGNVSTQGGTLTTINGTKWHKYGPYAYDTSAPSISVTIVDATTNATADWYKKAKATITVTESGNSGLPTDSNKYQYCLTQSQSLTGSESWSNYTNNQSFEIGENLTGKYYLHVKAISDNAGNSSGAVTKNVNFDNTPPQNVSLNQTEATETSFTLSTSAIDSDSGLSSSYEYYINGTKYTGGSTYKATGLTMESGSPFVPTGFSHTSGDINTGYIIKDTMNSNEFVWVPVKAKTYTVKVIVKDKVGNQSEYTKDVTLSELKDYINGLSKDTSNDYRDPVEDASSPTSIEYFKNSVYKNKGFYVGRYEAVLPDNISWGTQRSDRDRIATARTVAGKKPWNYISFEKAKTNSEAMYTGGIIQSGLMNSYSWCTTLNWFMSSGAKKLADITDSHLWGNYSMDGLEYVDWLDNFSGFYSEYSDGTDHWETDHYFSQNYRGFFKSGQDSRTCVNNIYDLAGNIGEWINQEVYNKTKRIF